MMIYLTHKKLTIKLPFSFAAHLSPLSFLILCSSQLKELDGNQDVPYHAEWG